MSTSQKQKQEFPLWVKTQLWRRKKTVAWLATRVGRHRTTVSTAINNPTRFPHTREAILRVLAA